MKLGGGNSAASGWQINYEKEEMKKGGKGGTYKNKRWIDMSKDWERQVELLLY